MNEYLNKVNIVKALGLSFKYVCLVSTVLGVKVIKVLLTQVAVPPQVLDTIGRGMIPSYKHN